MFNIAVIEDNPADMEHLTRELNAVIPEFNIEYSIKTFSNGIHFLETISPSYFDLIFLDIEMDGLDGMQVAKEIRMTDQNVPLVFVTNMAQYAINGYEVEAIGFAVKPINRYNVQLLLKKAINHRNRSNHRIVVRGSSEQYFFDVSDVFYIEVSGQILTFHTKHGDYKVNDRLKNYQEELNRYGFCQCNSCYLVNLQYISGINKDIVMVGDDSLEMSRRRKKDFLKAVAVYMGGRGAAQ